MDAANVKDKPRTFKESTERLDRMDAEASSAVDSVYRRLRLKNIAANGNEIKPHKFTGLERKQLKSMLAVDGKLPGHERLIARQLLAGITIDEIASLQTITPGQLNEQYTSLLKRVELAERDRKVEQALQVSRERKARLAKQRKRIQQRNAKKQPEK